MTANMNSQRAQIALRQMGENLKTARLKRRMAIKDFANRVGVSDRTIMRLEKGDHGVGTGTLAMAFLVLGEIDRFSNLLDPGSDDTALLLERKALPKRIDTRRRRVPGRPTLGGQGTLKDNRSDDQGVGF